MLSPPATNTPPEQGITIHGASDFCLAVIAPLVTFVNSLFELRGEKGRDKDRTHRNGGRTSFILCPFTAAIPLWRGTFRPTPRPSPVKTRGCSGLILGGIFDSVLTDKVCSRPSNNNVTLLFFWILLLLPVLSSPILIE